MVIMMATNSIKNKNYGSVYLIAKKQAYQVNP